MVEKFCIYLIISALIMDLLFKKNIANINNIHYKN